MTTIVRAKADRLSIAEAKALIRESLPPEPAIDYFKSDEGEFSAVPRADGEFSKARIDATFLDACRVGDIAPRNLYQPTLQDYTGEGLQDALYTITHDELVRLAGLYSLTVEVAPGDDANGPTYWTLRKAAEAIAEQEHWHDGARATFLEQMLQATRDGALSVLHPHTATIYRPTIARDFYELVTPTLVNEWLEKGPAQSLRWNDASKVRYSLVQFPRLQPRTPWRGGRLVDTDVLELAEAAEMATAHAGRPVRVADFLRAARKGEILLRAVLRRDVTMLPTRSTDKRLDSPALCIPTLPLAACESLCNVGVANWRTYESFESTDAFGALTLARFTRWELAPNEPDIVTTLEDCRVTGLDVHALADAFCDTPATGSEPEQVDPNPQPLARQAAPAIATKSPLPLTTPEIADAFDGIDGQSAEQWRRKLGDVNNHKWLLGARAEKAKAPQPARWWPIKLAELVLEREDCADSLNRAFLTAPTLKQWRPAWQEHRRERDAFGR